VEFDAHSVVRTVSAFERLDRLTLLGGEVFLHSEVSKLFREINVSTIREARVTTNLTVWPEEAISDALRHGFVFCVSIDGATAASHDRLRGSGSFKSTVKNLERLVSLDAVIEVTHTVCRLNIGEFPLLLRLCREVGIRSLNLHLVTPQGNAAGSDLTLTPSEWRRFVNDTFVCTEQGNGSIAVRYPLRYATAAEYDRLCAAGYHHHAESSFHSRGDRVVIYSTGEIFISSEAFGSDCAIGFIKGDRVVLNTADTNELRRTRSRARFDVSDLNPALAGDKLYPVALSVSFKLTARC